MARSPRSMLKFSLAALVLLLSGCALWDQFFPEEPEKSPAQLMSEGMEKFERGRLEAATEMFQHLKDRYPYSRYAVQAELKMAEALYKRKLYDEAADAFLEFERLHPKNPNIPYVIYHRAMCYFNKAGTIDRDQSSTHEAKKEFERLVKKFPKNDYAYLARMKIRRCYVNLAQHELYVGHYYYRMKKYRAAMGRYLYVIENYPDVGQFQEALEYLSKCKEKLAEGQQAAENTT